MFFHATLTPTVTLIQGHSPGGKRAKTFIRESEKGGQRGTTEVEKMSPGLPGTSVSRALTGVEAMGHHHAATAPLPIPSAKELTSEASHNLEAIPRGPPARSGSQHQPPGQAAELCAASGRKAPPGFSGGSVLGQEGDGSGAGLLLGPQAGWGAPPREAQQAAQLRGDAAAEGRVDPGVGTAVEAGQKHEQHEGRPCVGGGSPGRVVTPSAC